MRRTPILGVVIEEGRCVLAAPIVRYMIGWDEERIRAYCARKAWDASGGNFNINREITMRRFYILLFGLALAGVSHAAQAQGYIGIGFGPTSTDVLDEIVCLPGATCSFDDSDTGFKVFGGSRIAANFAFEGFYVDFGEATATGTDGVDTESISVDASAFGVAAVGYLPIADAFELLGKVGLAMWEADASASSTAGGFASASDDGTDPFFGIGAQWNGNGLAVRGEFERFDLDGTDVDLISISAIFRF